MMKIDGPGSGVWETRMQRTSGAAGADYGPTCTFPSGPSATSITALCTNTCYRRRPFHRCSDERDRFCSGNQCGLAVARSAESRMGTWRSPEAVTQAFDPDWNSNSMAAPSPPAPESEELTVMIPDPWSISSARRR